ADRRSSRASACDRSSPDLCPKNSLRLLLSLRSRQLRPLVFRNVLKLGVLAQLEHPDVSGNPPAIRGLNARGVAVHRAESIGHYLEEMPDGHFAQPRDVIRRRLRESALDDHAPAASCVVVARSAVDVVAL